MRAGRWALVGVAAAAAGWIGWNAARPVAVPLVTANAAPLVQTVVFSGRVAAPIRVDLGATVTGRIVEVPVREGDPVARGTLLARLESAELDAQLAQARAALRLAQARQAAVREVGVPTSGAAVDQAQASLDAAVREAQRSRELFARGYVSQARIDDTERAVRIAQAQLASARATAQANAGGVEVAQAQLRVDEARSAIELVQARLEQTRILAPADGRLVARHADPGQIVQPGRALFTFAAAGPTQLIGQADEKFLAQLAPGQLARAVADAFPQQPFDARITRIAPGVDAQRGTVEVRFEVGAPPPFLREDMSLSMQVDVGRRERALTLPAEAVLGPGAEATVRRLRDGRVVEQPVRVGLRTPQRVEIVEGLADGEAVLLDPLAVAPGARARPARDGEAGPRRDATGAADAIGAAVGAR
jgi:HlyD family secretion protein